MSAEHVAAMNMILRDAPAVRARCSALPRPYALAYRLGDGPGGGVVHWTMTFAETVQFALDEHRSPDVTFVGDWPRLVAAAAAGRRGEQLDPGVQVEGDPAVMDVIGPVFALAQSVATLPVTFPELR